jgi:hypothetical protein
VHARRLLAALSGAVLAALCPPVAAQGAATSAAYPVVSVLDAVKSACSDLSSSAAAERQVKAVGWVKVADPATTPVGPLVRFGYEAARKTGAELKGDQGVYSRIVAGEQLYLVLSGANMAGTSVLGCRVYDVNEARPLDAKAVQAWAGRAPFKTLDRAELTRLTWEPGLIAGQDSFEAYQVPAGSPVVAMTKIAGIAFKVDQVGSLQKTP